MLVLGTSLAPSILTGIFGLAGVAVGAGATVYVEWRAAARREKAEATRLRAERARPLREAGRVLSDELLDVMVLYQQLVARRLVDARTPREACPSWEKYQTSLAREIEDQGDWLDLYTGVSAARDLVDFWTARPADYDWEHQESGLPPEIIVRIEDWQRRIAAALAVTERCSRADL